MQQYEEEGKTETEKALRQLREYLRTHPDEMSRVCDIDECVQRGVTTKLDRFVAGNYSGLPRPEVAVDDAKEVSFLMKVLTFIARLVLFAGFVAALGYGLTLYYTYRIA